IERARQASQWASLRALKHMGGPAFQKELAALGDPAETAKRVEAVQADPLHGYDRYVVLYKGIKAWTYPEPLTLEEVLDDDGEKELRVPAIDEQFDDAQVNFLARAILDLTPRSDEASRKNAPSSSSTG